jgi:hypothetical protein
LSLAGELMRRGEALPAGPRRDANVGRHPALMPRRRGQVWPRRRGDFLAAGFPAQVQQRHVDQAEQQRIAQALRLLPAALQADLEGPIGRSPGHQMEAVTGGSDLRARSGERLARRSAVASSNLAIVLARAILAFVLTLGEGLDCLAYLADP